MVRCCGLIAYRAASIIPNAITNPITNLNPNSNSYSNQSLESVEFAGWGGSAGEAESSDISVMKLI